MKLSSVILSVFVFSNFAFASANECRNFSGTWDSIDSGCPGSHLIVQTGCSPTDTLSFGDSFLIPLNGTEVKRWPGSEVSYSATVDQNGDVVHRTHWASGFEDWTLRFDETEAGVLHPRIVNYDSNGQNPRESDGCFYRLRK